MTGNDVATQAWYILNDNEAQVTWTPAEMLVWVNAACREVVQKLPEAFTSVVTLTLVPGDTRQVLPAGTLRLISIHRNVGVSGTVPGKRVRRQTRNQLDSFLPNWHQATPKPEIVHYIYDGDSNLDYWVYPPPSVAVKLDARTSVIPPAIAALTDTLPILDHYSNAMANFVLFRAYSKDSDDTGYIERAKAFYEAFERSLDLKEKADTKVGT